MEGGTEEQQEAVNRLRNDKRALRREIIDLLTKTTEAQRLEESSHAANRIISTRLWHSAKRIFIFRSMDREIDTTQIIDHALTCGKVVALPRMEGRKIVFHRIEDLKEPFTRHAYGITEPAATLPVEEPRDKEYDLLIAPGAAFTREGKRLGYGKGYYDRYLAAYRDRVITIGLCFSFQLVENIPTGAFDIPVEYVVAGEDQEEKW